MCVRVCIIEREIVRDSDIYVMYTCATYKENKCTFTNTILRVHMHIFVSTCSIHTYICGHVCSYIRFVRVHVLRYSVSYYNMI